MVGHVAVIPSAFSLIIYSAFSPDAVSCGLIGVLIVGFQRAAFSNEAGIGSASIAHSAAKTNEPVSEGPQIVHVVSRIPLKVQFNSYHMTNMI